MYRASEFAIRHGLVYLEPRHVVEHMLEQDELDSAKQRIADLEAQLAEAQRREGLLRPLVVEWVYDDYGQFCIHCYAMKLDSVDSHAANCPYKAAIDGGAFGCRHESAVSAENEVVQSGWFCPDCNGIFADDPRGGALEGGE